MNNKIFFLLLVSIFGIFQGWGQNPVYTVNSISSVNSANAHAGSSATYTQTYNTTSQLTGGNSATLTLSGYEGKKITQIILSMKSNASSGRASLDMAAGTGTYPTGYNTIFSIPDNTFSNAAWYGSWSSSYVSLTKNLSSSYTVNTNEKVVIRISASANSVYIQSFTIVFEPEYYWDATAGINNGVGGSGTWSSQAQAQFSTVSTGSASLIAAPTNASIIYGGTTGGTVTLGFNATANSHTFNTTNYTLATSGAAARTLAGTINLNNHTLNLAPVAAAGLTLPGVISGSGNLVHNGVGVTTLSGANTFTGKIIITAGFINSTGESVFAVNPGSFTTDKITLNGGGIQATTGNINFSSNRGITLGASGGTFDVGTSRTITLTNVVTGTGGLTKTGTGTLLLAGNHTYTGNTTVTDGTLQLNAANRIANTSSLVFDGGTFRTGATTGYSETVGTLNLNANSTIALGTGNHSLTFANSSGVSWNGTTLTITGWTGTQGTSGTAGKIFVGNNDAGLTTEQLEKIVFVGFETDSVIILPTGEIVPFDNTSPYFEIENINGVAFGNVCVGATATTTGSFDLYGFNLTADNVTIGPLSGYTFSTDGTTFANSLTLSPDGGELAEAISIRFTPTGATSHNGSVIISGGGVSLDASFAVSGTGIINSTPTIAIDITTGNNPVCSGESITFTATTASLGGGTASYQWKLNGNNIGSNNDTYTSTTLANNDTVSCEITVAGGACMVNTTATSNTITMMVNAIPTITTVKPSSGAPVGTSVTILGSHFSAGSTVSFGGTAATEMQIISTTEIQAVVPANATDGIEVMAQSCSGTTLFPIINQDVSGCN